MQGTAATGPGRANLQTTLVVQGVGQPVGTALIGAGVTDVVKNVLLKGPQKGVQEMQDKYGLQHPLCKPLLNMLDYLDITRRDAHLHVLERARQLLLDWISSAQAAAQQQQHRSSDTGMDVAETQEEIELQEKLERLLNASFKYMGVPELQQVPIAVMSSMTHVPAPYLKQLAEDREIFNQLPPAVKMQVYEYDRNLLQQDAVQYIAAYKYELGTILAALNMCQFIRQRPRVCDKTPQHGGGTSSTTQDGAVHADVAPGLPKPGRLGSTAGLRGPAGKVAGRGRGGAGGFSVLSVLTAVSREPGQHDPAAKKATPQRTPLGNPPRSPSGAAGGVAVGSSAGGSGAARGAASLLPSRKTVRSGSEAIKQLREMVGNSGKVYGHLVELCEVRLKESDSPYLGSKELSYCALRTQLLMSLHDSSLKAPSNKAAGGPAKERDFLSRVREALPREGRSYDLVWLLDAALIQRRLTLQHTQRLGELFEGYIKPPSKFLEEEQEEGEEQQQLSARLATGKRRGAALNLPGRPAGAGGKQLAGSKRPTASATGSFSAAAAAAAGGGSRKRQRLGAGGSRGRGQVLTDDDDFREDWQGSDDDDDAQEEMKDFIVDELDAEDACGANAARTQDRWLAEAGMVLLDPPAMHMLAAEVADTLYKCLARGRLPSEVPQLAWLLRLMQLGVATRHSLRENQYSMPRHPSQQLHTVWAELLALLAEGEMDAAPWDQNRERQPGQLTGAGSSSSSDNTHGWQMVAAEYSKQEVLRKVIQMLILDRLGNGDLMTARTLLQLILASNHLRSAAAVPEYAPFAYSMASILQDLVKAGQLSASSSFWNVAVGDILLALVDADSQVHIEVLRLLLSVCKEVEPPRLANFLGHMLSATAASRAHANSQKKKFASITAQYGSQRMVSHVPGYDPMGGAPSEWSDGFRTVRNLKYAGSSDGYSELYHKIVAVGDLQDKRQIWPPALQQYMQDLEERRLQEEAARRAERQAAKDEVERERDRRRAAAEALL